MGDPDPSVAVAYYFINTVIGDPAAGRLGVVAEVGVAASVIQRQAVATAEPHIAETVLTDGLDVGPGGLGGERMEG